MLGLPHDGTVTGMRLRNFLWNRLKTGVGPAPERFVASSQGRVPTSTGWKKTPSMRRTSLSPASCMSSHSLAVDMA